MEIPPTHAGVLTAQIMARIAPHLQPDPPGSSSHSQRSWEAVLEILSAHPVLRLRTDPHPENRR